MAIIFQYYFRGNFLFQELYKEYFMELEALRFIRCVIIPFHCGSKRNDSVLWWQIAWWLPRDYIGLIGDYCSSGAATTKTPWRNFWSWVGDFEFILSSISDTEIRVLIFWWFLIWNLKRNEISWPYLQKAIEMWIGI